MAIYFLVRDVVGAPARAPIIRLLEPLLLLPPLPLPSLAAHGLHSVNGVNRHLVLSNADCVLDGTSLL